MTDAREIFEDWYQDGNDAEIDFTRWDDGEYEDDRVELAWIAWNGGIESQCAALAAKDAENQECAQTVSVLADALDKADAKLQQKAAEIERLNVLVDKLERANTAEASRNIDNYKQIEQLQARVKELECQICVYGREESEMEFDNDAECLQWFKELTSI